MRETTLKMRIKSHYRDLSPKEKIIADYVLAKSKDMSHMTISDISAELNIADSTFFQFTKKLGYSGFKDFKIALLSEESDAGISIHEKISVNDDLKTKITKVFDASIKTINDTKSMIDASEYQKAIEILNTSNRVIFFGIGGSNAVAMDAYHKFLRSPINPIYTSDSHMQLMNASLATANDCGVIICHTGLTNEVLQIASLLKENCSRIISITSYPLSPLAKLSDAILTTYADETHFRSESLSSRISQLTIIDSLFISISYNNENKSSEAIRKIRHAISLTKLSQ